MKASKLIQFLFAGCACISECLSEIVKHASVSVDAEGHTQARVFSNNWNADRSIRQQENDVVPATIEAASNCSTPVVLPHGKYVACYDAYNLEHATCISKIHKKFQNGTIKCGTCKDEGYEINAGMEPLWDNSIAWLSKGTLTGLSTTLVQLLIEVDRDYFAMGIDLNMCRKDGSMTKLGRKQYSKGGINGLPDMLMKLH